MLLILTNSKDATADYLVPILESASIGFVRFNTDRFVDSAKLSYSIATPRIEIAERSFEPGDMRNLWYRRPQRLGSADLTGPEGTFATNEWSEAFEAFLSHIHFERWMNHPSANAIASPKLHQLTVADSLGFNVPDTLVTQNPESALTFFEKHNKNVVIKPMSTGYVERSGHDDSLIYTNRVTIEEMDDASDLGSCPTLFQQYVDKQADIRITVVDHQVHAVELHAADDSGAQRCDIRRNNMADVRYLPTTLPSDISQLILRMMKHYRLRFAAIDMVVDRSGKWYFLEVNPNGQWAWLDLAGAATIWQSFVEAFSDVTR